MTSITTEESYMDQIAAVLGGESDKDIPLEWSYETKAEAQLARKDMVHKQKQLRQIKKEINQTIKTVRQFYAEEKQSIEPPSGFSSFFMSKKQSASIVAEKKREVDQMRDDVIVPYNDIKLTIDNIILQLDGVKLQVDQFISEN